MKQEGKIRTQMRTFCPVCNNAGAFIYRGVKDTMFHSEKEWDIRKCKNQGCGTLWLDPTPKEEDIPKLYAHYTTHIDPLFIAPKDTLLRKLLKQIRASYLSSKYGYKSSEDLWLSKLLGIFAYLHPGWRDDQEANIFYLPAKNNGVLLDVGCGAGNLLKSMQKMGWRGVGLDFDEKAVENAKRKGLDVHHGDLFSQKFPNDSFDAITMNHVIEHIPSPRDLLQECYRVLKKNGVMVIITPNAGSRGHAYFGRNWRGLEVPTHLQVFTVKSLGELSHKSGFSDVKSFSSLQGSLYILNASAQMAKSGTFDLETDAGLLRRITKELRFLILSWLHILSPNRDEVAVVVCRK